MICILRIIDECSLHAGDNISVKFWYANDILHVEFEWPGFEKRNKLTRLYTREMVENYNGDLTYCITDDFKRQVGSNRNEI